MTVNSIRLQGFRNYTDETINLSPETNVIRGENAQGKTNLLEAVYLLTCGHGFRTRLDRELIGFNTNCARIVAEIFAQGRPQIIEIRFGRGIKKQVLVNGVAKSTSELSEILRVVLFCPDDLNMIRDGAKARRRFMDMAISQLRPSYSALITEYTRLCEHKRRILCDCREKPSLLYALEEYSDGMNRCGAKIIRYRAAFTKRLAETARPIHSEFSGSGEKLSIAYETVSTVSDPFAPASEIYKQLCEHTESHRRAEIASGNLLTGIHKDDLNIQINEIAARQFASQGQTRTAALSLKMAEREISLQDTGEVPILLLDDVLSELDAKRRDFVLNRIGSGQTLISCCEDEDIKAKTGGRVITVKNGRCLSS
ncbi:MAG: DNA replication/repair protein RecF [Oscillospiraceae bacterium]